jgi:hypothetical protein
VVGTFVSVAFTIDGILANTTAPKIGNAFFAALLKNSLLEVIFPFFFFDSIIKYNLHSCSYGFAGLALFLLIYLKFISNMTNKKADLLSAIEVLRNTIITNK